MIAAATIAGMLFLFFTISGNVERYGQTVEDARAQIISGEKNFDHVAKIADLIKSRKSDISHIRNIMIDRARPLVFIETMERISHLTNTKIVLSIDEKKGGNDALFFSVAIEGNQQNVRTMIALMMNLPYDIAIDTMTFQREALIQQLLQGATRVLFTMRVKAQ